MQTSDDPSSNVQTTARFLKLLFFAMVFTVGMYAAVIQIIGPSADHVSNGIKIGLEACAAAAAMGVLFVRFVMIAGVLVQDAPAPAAERLVKLRSYFVICYVASETVALFGFVLRFMGGRMVDAAPFFVGSLLLYALCYPRLPEDLDRSQT